MKWEISIYSEFPSLLVDFAMRAVPSDEKSMRSALQLALIAKGHTRTNPMVGCIIVKNGGIIGSGYHHEFGGPHAEVFALKAAGKHAKGATIYVNLEPCVHFEGKKTPACATRLVESGVSEVVIAMPDPNPKVNGRGISILRNAGIKVRVGVLGKEARSLNAPYAKFITTGKPYVFLKVAMSIDKKIAIPGRKYFSGKESLRFAHRLRAGADAILVGVGTILKDNPSLTTRLVKGKDPVRVILDDKLNIPLNAKALKDKKVLVVAGKKSHNKEKLALLNKHGYSVLILKQKGNHIDLNALLLELGKRNICTLMVEGGSQVITSFFNEKLFDKCYFVVVPEMFGKKGTPLFSDPLKAAVKFRTLAIMELGRDLIFETTPIYSK
ncbi:MAG: bifunctional diaminohydroxyphosphoribosylaminopyrimidine deaminase/5-amino-6-(5-phosphoribosylamino)uracil reductase RibD [Candidatus Micrarchaeota archaeon]